MLTAHQTIKTAWTNFKSYPKLKQVLLFFILVGIPSYITQVYFDGQLVFEGIDFFASILALILYFLTYMAVAHYVCNGWVFNSFREFLRPPSSIWKLFWKSLAVFVIVSIPLFIMLMVFWTSLMAPSSAVSHVLLATGLAISALVYIAIFWVKIIIVNPYFTMNENASLLSSLRFSKGYVWYLSKILGWMFLYGLFFSLVLMVFAFAEGLLFGDNAVGLIGGTIIALLALILQAVVTVLIAFIYAEAYKQIAEDK